MNREYLHLVEKVYDFQLYNLNDFLYGVQFLHKKICIHAGILDLKHPMYHTGPVKPKHYLHHCDEHDVTRGELERLCQKLVEEVYNLIN
jgi:hypothetical protein